MANYDQFRLQLKKKKSGMFIGYDEDILDPDITDDERQLRYQKFKHVTMNKLSEKIRKYKLKHRIECPEEYDSDEDLSSLFKKG